MPSRKTSDKTFRELTSDVDVSGAIISMDAHYTYMDELKKILQHGAHFLVGIKGNQGSLAAEVKNYFEQAC